MVVGAEVAEPGGGVVDQVPDDDQDGSGDREEGLEFAAAFDDAPVACAEEGVGFGSRRGGLAECAFRYGLPLPVRPARLTGPDWMVRGDSFAQDTRCPAVGNRVMSKPTSAMIAWAPDRPMPVI